MSTEPQESIGIATAEEWSHKRWVRINSAALAITLGMWALLGGTAEAFGAAHDSLIRNVFLLLGVAIGGASFGILRQRALRPEVKRAGMVGVAATVGGTISFLAGFLLTGLPPVYFALAIMGYGVTGSLVERRRLRKKAGDTGGLSRRSTLMWVVAGLSMVLVIVLGPAFDALDRALRSLLGETAGDVASFAAILAMVGAIGGATGGYLEGRVIQRNLLERQANQAV